MKRSKRYKNGQEKIDRDKEYNLEEALKLAKETAPVKFDASLELHLKLGIDSKKSNQQVRGTVVLPHGTGKTKKIAVFVSPAKEKEAKQAGADIIGDAEFIKQIKDTKKCDFDVAVAEPAVMKNLAPVAKILGQKGLMPNPKTETVTPDVKTAIEELKKGKITFRADDGGSVHQMIGKVSFEDKKLLENINTFMEAIKKARPDDSKGTYIHNVVISASMGPGIKVNI